MSSTAGASLAAAGAGRRLDRLADRLLVRLPAGLAVAAVAVYVVVHRDLVLGPGGELWAALAGGGWAAAGGLHGSFALLLLPPVAVGAALAATIWPWSGLVHRRPTLRLLSTLVAVSAVIVLLQLALGAAGRLGPGSLAVSAGVLVAASWVAWRVRRGARHRSATTGAARLAGSGPLAELTARLGLAPPTRLGVALGAAVAASWLTLGAIGALAPPWGWDALVYHLTDVFWFAQTGTVEPFPHPIQQFHFPKVAELHALWFYLLAGGGAGAWRVTGVALLPLALTAGIAMRAAGELLGLRSALAWLAPAMMLVPLALIQPLAGYADLAFTAFLLAAFAFLLAALRRGRTADWALTALACGLAMGSKLSFLYLALPLPLLLLGWRPRPRAGGRVIGRLALCGLLFAAGCGFWLLPKLLRTGNPLHPVALTVGGRTLLDGPVSIDADPSSRLRYTGSLAGWLLYPFHERFQGRVGYSPDNGFGPQFAAALLALPFALALAARRRRRLLTLALLAAPATLAAWLALSPWEHPRYALTACGFALLGLAAVEEFAAGGPGASPGARRLLRSAVVVALLFAAPAGLLAAAPELPHAATRWKAGDWRPSEIYAQVYGPAGRAFNWISDNGGEGTTVSFDRPTFVAPLFGWHGRNRVVYAATPAERGGATAAIAGSSRAWRRFLERERVDYLVLWHDWWEERPAPSVRQRWIEARPEAFVEIATFGEAARILEPRGSIVEPAATLGLAELSDPALWELEYATGAKAELAPDPAGGMRLDYRFLTARPDYLDLRLGLVEGDWQGRLVFDIEASGGSPLIWVYLKEADPRRHCRFRIGPRAAAAGRVVVDLSRPEDRTPGFALRRAAWIHLVLDDQGATRAASGSLRLHDFRLEPATAPWRSAGRPHEEGA